MDFLFNDDEHKQEVVALFVLLCVVVSEVSRNWAVVLTADPDNYEDISWIVFPYEGDISEEEDLFIAEEHPDKLILRYRDGIFFSKPPESTASNWMLAQLRAAPDLAGRII